ncbi:MAG TPA: N-acetyl sugar amidotransferase [Ignavibacteriaceae bacterium]|nr:N-acetyl sugar amidotransferase [Ignavibacteriaceae bacterium]
MTKKEEEYKICTRGIWDTTVPGITFDENGVSNYAHMLDKLIEISPEGKIGNLYWENIVDKMKEKGRQKKYDCIIGVSGGTDSSYLMHIGKKEYGLRPLAVNLDNGWSSEIAVQNIKKVTKVLDIDLETYVINYDEVKAVLRAYMKAGLPWVDGPTDNAIKAVLFKIADREGIKFVLNGSDFRSEGKQPSEWTYTDSKQMLFLLKKYEKIKLKTYPYQSLFDIVNFSLIKKIKDYRPFNHIEYEKKPAKDFLTKEYGWEYYGGHHHENIFTRFAIGYWMPKKFGIDKRIITLSAQVLTGQITREDAIEKMKHPPYGEDQMEKDKTFVIKKLDMTKEEFDIIWNQKNKYYWNYPSYMPLFEKYFKLSKSFLRFFFPTPPTMIVERQTRKNENIN